MGAGRHHLSARARQRALAAQPIGGPVVELAPSSYAGRDAPPATLTRWQGGQWGTLSWADVVGWMQAAEASGSTTDWARLTRRMYQDGHLLALRGTRVDPVAGAGYDVSPGGPTQADALAAQDVAGMLASLSDLPTYLDAILDAEFVGWSVLEIMWGVRGSWVWPEGMEILEPHRFRFDRLIKPYLWDDGRLANSPGANPQIGLTGLPLRENKFVVHMPRVIPDYTIASGLLRACVRYWWVKWTAAAYWLNGAEVAGNPRAIGKYPNETAQPLRQELFDNLSNLSASGVAVMSKDMEIQLLNPSAQGSSSVWTALESWCDDGMTKAVLGSTLNTDIGAIGSRAAAESQASTTIHPRLKKSASSMWATVSRDLVRPFLEFNLWRYGGTMPALPVIATRFQEELAPKPSDVLIDVGAVTVDELRKRDGLPEWGAARGGNAKAKRVDMFAAAPMAAPMDAPATAAPEAVADTALNGAQIASLIELLAAVTAGTMAPAAAVVAIRKSFPTIAEAEAIQMVEAQSALQPPTPTDGAAPTEAAPVIQAARRAEPESGQTWTDTEDGHRLEVVAVDDSAVWFRDLDGPNPRRQWRWARKTFMERAAPVEAAPAEPVVVASAPAGQLAAAPSQTTYASGGAPPERPLRRPWELVESQTEADS